MDISLLYLFVYVCQIRIFSDAAWPTLRKGPFAASREPREIERVAAEVVDAAYHLHRRLGPGLLESVYEAVLARQLEQRGLAVDRQRTLPFEFDGMRFDEGLRIDLLVEGCLIVELKSVEYLARVHGKQLLTYLRLLGLPLGLLFNFGAASFKDGVRRVVNDHRNFAASNLRLHRR